MVSASLVNFSYRMYRVPYNHKGASGTAPPSEGVRSLALYGKIVPTHREKRSVAYCTPAAFCTGLVHCMCLYCTVPCAYSVHVPRLLVGISDCGANFLYRALFLLVFFAGCVRRVGWRGQPCYRLSSK